jgi:hypothetical protein
MFSRGPRRRKSFAGSLESDAEGARSQNPGVRRGGWAKGETAHRRMGPVGRRSRRAHCAPFWWIDSAPDLSRACGVAIDQRSSQRQGWYSEVSAARSHHTPTAQIRRDSSKDVKTRHARAEIFALPGPFADAPFRLFADAPSGSWILAPGSWLLSLDRSPNAGYIALARERFTLPRSG